MIQQNNSKQMLQGNELCVFPSGERGTHDDFSSNKNILLIHGFTAHGAYFNDMADNLHRQGFNCLIYNYNSYCGIEDTAQALKKHLDMIDSMGQRILTKKKLHIVAHSMGGLIARAFIAIPGTEEYVKSIITLGTPHIETELSSTLLKKYIKWGEYISDSLIPGFISSKSALELLGMDSINKDQCLLTRLSKALTKANVPIISVSGGLKKIKLSKNPLLNVLLNHQIQKILDGQENDGLVPEKCSNIQSCNTDGYIEEKLLSHYNDYPEYPRINHSGLVGNNFLSLQIGTWLDSNSTN